MVCPARAAAESRAQADFRRRRGSPPAAAGDPLAQERAEERACAAHAGRESHLGGAGFLHMERRQDIGDRGLESVSGRSPAAPREERGGARHGLPQRAGQPGRVHSGSGADAPAVLQRNAHPAARPGSDRAPARPRAGRRNDRVRQHCRLAIFLRIRQAPHERGAAGAALADAAAGPPRISRRGRRREGRLSEKHGLGPAAARRLVRRVQGGGAAVEIRAWLRLGRSRSAQPSRGNLLRPAIGREAGREHSRLRRRLCRGRAGGVEAGTLRRDGRAAADRRIRFRPDRARGRLGRASGRRLGAAAAPASEHIPAGEPQARGADAGPRRPLAGHLPLPDRAGRFFVRRAGA